MPERHGREEGVELFDAEFVLRAYSKTISMWRGTF